MSRVAVALLVLALPLTAVAAPETYTLDPYHTYPNFTIEHLGFSMIYGRFDKSSGKFILDRAAKTASLEMMVETASINAADNEKATASVRATIICARLIFLTSRNIRA